MEHEPITGSALFKYVNDAPALLSLLYDIDLMPEQLIDHQDSPEWQQMVIIVNYWRERELQYAEEKK